MTRSISKLMHDLPFSRKILLYGAAVSLISLVLAAAGIVTYDAIVSRRVFADRIVSRADMLAQLCGSSLAFNDQAFASTALKILHKKHDVRAACLYSSDGSVFARFADSDETPVFPKDPTAPSQAIHDRHVEVLRPVMFGGQQVGMIYMRCRNDELAGRFGGNIPIMAGVFLVSLAAALVLCLRFQRVINQPVLELERVAQAVSRNKDYAARAVKFGDDELGRLTDTVNTMIEDIQTTLSALQESEERYRSAQAAGHVGSWEYDPHTTKFSASDESKRLYGFDPESSDFSTVEVEKYIPDRERVHQALVDLIETNKPYNLEFEIHPRNGTEPKIITSIAELKRDEHGNPQKVVGIIQDITKRKQAEEKVRRLNKELEQRVKDRTAELEAVNRELEAFSYSVSHDLKAPLRSVDGFAQMLEEDYAERLDDEGRRLLRVVRDSARDMGHLINDLLAFSRLSRKDLRMGKLNLYDLVEETRVRVEADADARIIRWEVGELPSAYGDEATLREVLINLFANAVKFTRPRPEAIIGISGHVEGNEAIYAVTDNGVGFDMAYKDKLFSVFQRLHTADEFEGTGIGLALVQRIIQRHGGRVWAEGKVDEGATFYFALPGDASSLSESAVTEVL